MMFFDNKRKSIMQLTLFLYYLGTYIATKYSSNRSTGESGVMGEDMDLGGNVLGKLLGSWGRWVGG